MKLKPIRTQQDYEEALHEIERLWDVDDGTPQNDKLEILVTLVEHYEREHYELPPPDPIAALEYFMESRGWTRKDLEPYIGSRARVAEILERKRPLTLAMIRKLQQATEIPVAILIQPYELKQDDDAADTDLSRMAHRMTSR